MNYRDFYKNNKSPWKEYYHLIPEGITPKQFEKGADEEYKEHPQLGRGGAARVAAQHLGDHPDMYKKMEEKELLKGINLEDNAVDDGLPKREDGSLDIEHDGRPIHLSKIIQVGAEFGKGPATGELGGMSAPIGSQHKSPGADKSKGELGPQVSQDGDKEPIIAGGKEVNPDIASKSVGGEVTGGQEQGGPNTKGSIAGTPEIGGGPGKEDGVFSLDEARSKLREMVKEVLKEITFDKKTGKWTKINENLRGLPYDSAGFPTTGVPGRPQYKVAGPKIAGSRYRVQDDNAARAKQFEPEITEMYDEEEECAMQERYTELANAKRNLSESELCEMRDLGLKLEKKDKFLKKAINPAHKGYCTPMTKKTCTPHRKALAKRFKKGGDLHKDETVNEAKVDMKMGPSHKVVQPTLAKTSEPDQFARTNEYDPEVSEDVEVGHDETNVANSEEKSEVEIGQQIKALADKLIGMHEPEEPEVEEPIEKPIGDEETDEVAPPGWEKTVKAMKKHSVGGKKKWDPKKKKEEGLEEKKKEKKIDNPYALAWWMKNKGYKSHKEEEEECMDEAGGAAVQHSSGRTVNDRPQVVKNRHRGDIDENLKKK